jgi:hypothetical protein
MASCDSYLFAQAAGSPPKAASKLLDQMRAQVAVLQEGTRSRAEGDSRSDANKVRQH